MDGTLGAEHDVTTLVSSKLTLGYINIGVKQTDLQLDVTASINIYLKVTYSVPLSLTADNNFSTSDGKHGVISVNGITGTPSAPLPFTRKPSETAIITAVSPQTDAQNYQRIWSTAAPLFNSGWTAKNLSGNFPLPGTITNISYTTISLTDSYNGATFVANLLKVCNVSVQNSFVGLGNGGTIIVNGIQYSSPFATTVIEQNPITVSPQNQTINGIDYVFHNWSDDINNNTNPRTFYPGENSSITAVFVGTPNISLMNVQNNSTVVGAHPTLTWTDNINPNVSYQIYKSTKLEGQNEASPFTLIASVAKNVQHYSANGYVENDQKVNLLWLQLRPIYSVENTSISASTVMFDIVNNVLRSDKRNFANKQVGDIAEYKLYENFPNPFNPSTEIYYQIPSGGNVKLKVYNMMGQEVMTLVNEFKEKGMYNVSFNAGRLASGIYIYKLEAGNFVQIKKMILTK